jgi:hypothetical protein
MIILKTAKIPGTGNYGKKTFKSQESYQVMSVDGLVWIKNPKSFNKTYRKTFNGRLKRQGYGKSIEQRNLPVTV